MTQLQDPLSLVASLAQNLLTQGTVAVQQLTSGVTQASSQLLSTLAQGPLALLSPGGAGGLGLPGLPGVAGLPGLPTPQQLIPVQAIQGLAQLEQAALPPGLPRVSQLIMGLIGGAPPVDTTAPGNNAGNNAGNRAAAGAPPQLLPTPASEVVPSAIRRRTLGLEGVNGVRPRTAARGLQLY